MHRIVIVLAVLLAGCGVGNGRQVFVSAEDWNPKTPALRERAPTFRQVSRAVGDAATDTCRRQSAGRNCDFRILVDLEPFTEPNAFQTLDDEGHPLIIFSQKMIQSTRNGDEMAFVMSHEAAHHILSHIARQIENANEGARVFGELAQSRGEDPEGVELARKLGAEVGVQSYTKTFELEADKLGTIIAFKAGYNPLVGMDFFNRIPDPGGTFLATHPPNSKRAAAVLETAAELDLVR